MLLASHASPWEKPSAASAAMFPSSRPATDAPPAVDPALSALCLALGAVALGQALEQSNGHLDPTSIRWLSAALALLAAAAVVPRLGSREAVLRRLLPFLLLAGLAFQLSELRAHVPGIRLGDTSAHALQPFRLGIAACGLFALGLLSPWPGLRRASFVLLVAIHFLLGSWLIRAAPNPHIDVWVIHRDSLDRLLAGGNPYAMDFPNIYHSTTMYGPGQTLGDRLNFGYCYMPLTLLLSLPGHVLGGDYRYSQLAAMALTALLLGFARPSRTAFLAAALLLYTPRVFYVVEQGWTDPYVALCFALVVFAALRWRRALGVALGLFFVSKQYTPLAVPAALMLLPQRLSRKTILQATAVGAAVTLPFVFWDVRAFVWDCLVLQVHSPFRPTALSYLAWFFAKTGRALLSVVGFIAAVLAIALSLAWRRRGPAFFAGSCALVYFAFFAFNKQAFCNYYFLVLAMACAGVAAALPSDLSSPAK